MTIEKFLKPNKTKIAILLLLLLIFCFFSIYALIKISCVGLVCPEINKRIITAKQIAEIVAFPYKLFPNIFGIIITPVIWYILSCLLEKCIQKFNNKTIKLLLITITIIILASLFCFIKYPFLDNPKTAIKYHGQLTEKEIIYLDYPNDCISKIKPECLNPIGVDLKNNKNIAWFFEENCFEKKCELRPTYSLYYPEIKTIEECKNINGTTIVSTSIGRKTDTLSRCIVTSDLKIEKSELLKLSLPDLQKLTLPLVCKEKMAKTFLDRCHSQGLDLRNNERVGWIFGCNDECNGDEYVLAYTDIENEAECQEKKGIPVQGYGWVSGYWYCAVPNILD